MKVNDLITTLRNMNVSNILDEEYMVFYNGKMILNALTSLTILLLDPLHYRPKEMLNSMIIHIQHFQLPAGTGNP